jgi:uncharacterized protein (TIGR03083 family)
VTEPIVDVLENEWAAIAALASTFSDEEWELPTALPGWTVRDNVSHVIGIERSLLGDPAPEVDLGHIDRIAGDPFASIIECWVEARRTTPGPEVAAELDEVVVRRLEQLRSMTDEDFDRVGWSPIGEVPYRRFMVVRVFDCWMHEQDMRRAVGREGHLEGPAVDVALEHFTTALGFVVGKKAGAPQGSSVVFDVDGPTRRRYGVAVEGRAQLVDPAPDDPTVTISLPLTSFVALGGGRWSAEEARAAGELEITGDIELGERVLANMGFTP